MNRFEKNTIILLVIIFVEWIGMCTYIAMLQNKINNTVEVKGNVVIQKLNKIDNKLKD
jgi:hypothetical protein